jgi:hypothetical protein
MTKEFPNDSMILPYATPVELLIRASGFFRHYGLGISHSAERSFKRWRATAGVLTSGHAHARRH